MKQDVKDLLIIFIDGASGTSKTSIAKKCAKSWVFHIGWEAVYPRLATLFPIGKSIPVQLLI